MDARGKIKVKMSCGIWMEFDDKDWQFVDDRSKKPAPDKPHHPADNMDYGEYLQYQEDYAYKNCY